VVGKQSRRRAAAFKRWWRERCGAVNYDEPSISGRKGTYSRPKRSTAPHCFLPPSLRGGKAVTVFSVNYPPGKNAAAERSVVCWQRTVATA
jgi:hypothetical protein